MVNKLLDPGSFRDPSGYIFRQDGKIYRQVNLSYKEDYDHLMTSGLYHSLVSSHYLIAHEVAQDLSTEGDEGYLVVKPQVIPFISYPYEWCFSELKAAALATLEIQKEALEYDMCLKDCSAYNMQFNACKPILIDTLSFEKYHEGQPWVALRQFCQHFLAPLALMSYKDVRLNQLLRIYIDGIPLDLASSLLPWNSWFSPSLISYIHLHAKSQKHYADKPPVKYRGNVSRLALRGFVASLESAVTNLKCSLPVTEWRDYYENTNYSQAAFDQKKGLVSRFLSRVAPNTVWDLGANVGVFSRLASSIAAKTVSIDADPAAVETNYVNCIKTRERNILPLVMDLTNPSPDMGWASSERMSLFKRGPADVVLALAVIHHLAISNNLPLDKIAHFFSSICKFLIIEFIPKNDSQVQKLLSTREDCFVQYQQQSFESTFESYFKIIDAEKLYESDRKIYLMQRI